MANQRPGNGWEDKKRPMFRNDTSINKRPRLDVRVVSSGKSSGSPLKNASPLKSFKRSTSLPGSSRNSPSPTDEILLCAVKATEEEEARIAKELKGIHIENTESKDANKINVNPSCKTTSNQPAAELKKSDVQQTGNNGSSGFDRLFCDEINEDFVEECMNLATALSQQPRGSSPPPMSQAYEFFFQGVKSHSSVLEKTVSEPGGSAFRPAAGSSGRLALNQRNQTFRKPQPPEPVKPKPVSTLATTKEENRPIYPPGAEAQIRRLELEVERLTSEKKQIKEHQNTKDGEAAVLRFQVNESQNQMNQLKATQAQALSAMNVHYTEKMKEIQKENENLRSQLQIQALENNSIRERTKLLESSHSRIRLVEPHSPKGSPSLNSSISKTRPQSAFLNRSTFDEDLRSPPKPSNKIPTPTSVVDQAAKTSEKIEKSEKVEETEEELHGSWYRLNVPKPSVGCSLALRLAGWERIEADDSDDSCSSKRVEYDQDSSLDLLRMAPVPTKKRTRLCNEDDRPGLAACAIPLRSLFLWPESTLESPAAQILMRKVIIECCGLVHYKYVLLKDLEVEMDEKVLHERDCDIIEKGGHILELSVAMDLLDDRPWYKGERGLSSRRALGLLSELAFFSKSASDLLTGSLSSQQPPLERHRFTQLPDFVDDCSSNKKSSRKLQSAKNDDQEASGEQTEMDEAPDVESPEDTRPTWSDPDRYWFLEVAAQLCQTIVRQKRTNQFNGVFVGLLTLLKNCARNGDIIGEARPIVLRIIRGILLARPSFYTLRCVLNLLEELSDCEDLMTGLCTYNDHDDYQEDVYHGLYYFKSDSCPLQLLCAQLNSAGASRWRLADPMVRWLLAVFAHTTIPPPWLVPHVTGARREAKDQEDSGKMCCARTISTAVTLIYDAFQTFKSCIELGGEREKRGPAPRVMQRALILLHSLVVNDLSESMGRVEGDYDVLIPGLNQIRQHLDLAPVHEKLLSDLVRLEESCDTAGEVDPGSEDIVPELVWEDAGKRIVLT